MVDPERLIGRNASQTVRFQVSPLVSGSTPVVVATAKSLVALFGSPSCPAGSTMRTRSQPQVACADYHDQFGELPCAGDDEL